MSLPNISLVNQILSNNLEKGVLGIKFYHNTLYDWLLACLSVLLITLALFLFKRVLIKRFGAAGEAESGMVKTWLSEIFKRTKASVLLILAVYFSSISLTLSGSIFDFIRTVTFVAVIIQMGIWGGFFLREGIKEYAGRRIKDPSANAGVAIMTVIVRAVFWALVLLWVLDTIGFNVTALVASLGIGGIAIGLATQNILGDLFASLSILLDRPFEVGHFIIVDDYLGTVERIGIKTTRIRSLSGELLIFGNNDLLKSRVRNYTFFWERRVVFTFGVTYDTPAEKLRQISLMVRKIIEEAGLTRFDRAHFKGFGDFSLNFECVYYVLSPDYTDYMNTQEKINLAIVEKFETEKIRFAFPTRTIHVESQPGSAV